MITATLVFVLLAGPGDKVLDGAKSQLAWKTAYTTGYVKIPYPGGDLPRNQGVCTDVVIRALRYAGRDLQALIHTDMKAHFAKYPQNWGAKRTDANIDHRRVPNQIRFLERFGKALPRTVTATTLKEWKPGDLVYWKLPNGLDHCGVVSDIKNRRGVPFAIHNIAGIAEEDCLQTWTITGHFRYPK